MHPKTQSFRYLLMTPLVAALASGCAPQGSMPASPPEASEKLPQPAPPLHGTLIDGGSFDLAARDGQVTVIDFWAVWCEPCRRTLPFVAKLHAQNLEGVNVIAVSVDDSAQVIAPFLSDLGLSLPVLHDHGGAIAQAWAPPAMPTAYVVGPHGKIQFELLGEETNHESLLNAKVKQALQGS